MAHGQCHLQLNPMMSFNPLYWIPPLTGLAASVLTAGLLIWVSAHWHWGMDKGSGVQSHGLRTELAAVHAGSCAALES